MSALLEVNHLKKYFKASEGSFGTAKVYVKAVDDISFSIAPNETLGLVGESGSGKSTLGRSILKLIEPDSGEVIYDGQEISSLGKGEMQKLRRKMQIIFQDPYSSLNPRKTIRQIVEEPLLIHEPGYSKAERRERVADILHLVGLNDEQMDRYPHEFSGGQRQRVGIARALVIEPKFIVCDEPVSALDVSVQSQVINLLCDLQDKLGLTYLFIAHGLNVVKYVSDRIAVMYLGKIVEIGDAESIYRDPAHPYTKALIQSIVMHTKKTHHERVILSGEIPSPTHPPQGCRFCTRCPLAQPICHEEEPAMRPVGDNRCVSCHLIQQ